MKITSVTLQRVDRQLSTPVGTSLGSFERISGYLVEITCAGEGLSGYGWAHENAFVAGETAASIHDVIERVVKPCVLGQDPRDIAVLMERIDGKLAFNYRAKSAVDMALHDLASKAAGVPLFRWLGGAHRKSVACIRMLGLSSPDEMAQETLQLRNQGFLHFKLKIDGSAADEDRVRAVADVLGKEGRLVLDANQAYTPKGIIQFANRIHDCKAVNILEQPVGVDDLDGMALVRSAVDLLVEADECVRTIGEARRVLDKNAADIISLKVPKMGGVFWTRKIADLCQAYGVPNIIGATVGSCIFDLVHTHLACSHPNVSVEACEIGDSLRFVDDIATGLSFADGHALLPEVPGIGATLQVHQ